MSTFREPDLREVVVSLGHELETLRAENEALRTEIDASPNSLPRTSEQLALEAERRRKAQDALAALDEIARRNEGTRAPTTIATEDPWTPPTHTDERVDFTARMDKVRPDPGLVKLTDPTRARETALGKDASEEQEARTKNRLFSVVVTLAGAAWLFARLVAVDHVGLGEVLALVLIVIGLVSAKWPVL